MSRVIVTDDIATCHALRRTVFIGEQAVPEHEEIDGRDGEAVHLLAFDGARPVGTARILVAGSVGKIGRVCVLREARGAGHGAALTNAALAWMADQPGIVQARLGAQLHALDFYARLGFVEEGEVFLDAGIPHREMVRTL
ncbi:GNAT family N-acetyltransferase [Profundibacterium mesophilum]|uniref:Acetyltransferase GNAT family protein n=1 Tax=Profundibacterium mesophilum KAUST100406-0324 TaxID=1037889 RepID=A0A921TDM3_9RHOB|nr:GNAT family N-acetyltransferase [Profundibacterium mesophilum]KAF0676486.1 Acetyltransferase GNAT family protein [Profundibacterium mesophilum KAUST100406-0324]